MCKRTLIQIGKDLDFPKFDDILNNKNSLIKGRVPVTE